MTVCPSRSVGRVPRPWRACGRRDRHAAPVSASAQASTAAGAGACRPTTTIRDTSRKLSICATMRFCATASRMPGAASRASELVHHLWPDMKLAGDIAVEARHQHIRQIIDRIPRRGVRHRRQRSTIADPGARATADHRPRPRPLTHRRQPAARAGADRCSARQAGRGTDHRRRGTAELRGSADCGRRPRLPVRGTPT